MGSEMCIRDRDEAGNAQVRFYNNSRCRRLKITAEMISADGAIGMFNE